MLTDLRFLNKGETWPPEQEAERLKMYSSNRNLFEGKHVHEYMEDLKRIESYRQLRECCFLSYYSEFPKDNIPQSGGLVIGRSAYYNLCR